VRQPGAEFGRRVRSRVLDNGSGLSVPWPIDEAIERRAVAARRAVQRRWFWVVRMCDMRNRIQRKGQQQAGESDSQPLRRHSGQRRQTHECNRYSGFATGYGFPARV
jgi:hypothetical protein